MQQINLIEFRKTFDNYLASPTSEQNTLMRQLSKFALTEVEHPLYILRGYAGTGKTTVLGAFIKTLKVYKMQTVLMAPTGRAAKVLSQKSSKSASTIHKAIYRLKSSSDIGSSIELAPNLKRNTIFIVDEASMIGESSLNEDGNVQRNLLEDLIEFVYGSQGCKLIFLGDEGQLPPVGSSNSPALSIKHLQFNFPKLKIATLNLTEVVRQASESTILKNATFIRSISEIEQLKLITGVDFKMINGGELQEYLESAYDLDGFDETLVITRSNKNANAYNNQIRSRILWYEDEICHGDLMMVVKNNYYWLKEFPDIGFIANGESIKIKRILKYENIYGFDFAKVIVEMLDHENLEFEVIVLLETLQIDAPALSRARQKELFFAVEGDYLHEKNKKKRYDLILSNPYYNALQVKFAYAVTCHKAQGGQWNNVFIDQGFVPEEIEEKEYLRWLYTAVTRAKNKIYMVNFPDKNKADDEA